MTVRDDLAAAATAVLDAPKAVSSFYRNTTKVGTGWVELLRADRDDSGLGFMDRWAVKVVLHQDLNDAEAWIDSHRDALVAALQEVMIVLSVIPATLVLDNGTTPGLVIEGTRAH